MQLGDKAKMTNAKKQMQMKNASLRKEKKTIGKTNGIEQCKFQRG